MPDGAQQVVYKFCRKGKDRAPRLHVVAVADGAKVHIPGKQWWRNYELSLAHYDAADADLAASSFTAYVTDTKAFRRHRDDEKALARGAAHDYACNWLMDRKGHTGPGCLYFPGMVPGAPVRVKYNYRFMSAAKAMLLMTQGNAPEGKPLATHICGCGHLSCVNPDHLKWDSVSGNAADREIHRSSGPVQDSIDEDTIRAIRKDPRLVKVIAWERELPAGIVSGIKTGRLWASVA